MSRTPLTPLVGRDAETEWLLAAVERARAGRAGTAFITGEAGIGKTRLARYVADEAARRGFAVAEGRAFAAESGLPYAIVADALLPHLRRLDSATLTLFTRGAGGDLAGVLPSLFPPGMVNAAEGAAERKARMFWSLTELLERLATRQPLLLVLDNVQWADPSSLELLHFVSRQLHASPKGAPLLIVGTCVDTERERHAGVRAMVQSLVALGAAEARRLSALSLEQTVELVSRQFDMPGPTVRRLASLLHEWTRGNPFYIEETLKSLVERGQLRREGEAWRDWDEEALTPPNSVREVVLGRVERLGEKARALLEIAAVLGARVTLASLRQASGLAADQLADALEELLGAAFLIEDAGTATYDFAHPLVRDSVYASLGQARAQVLHDRIAAALEAMYGSNAAAHAAELAHHLTRGSDGAGGERAARYLGEAGRQALARHADRAAVEYLEAAIATGQRDVAYDLLVPLAVARQRVGDMAGAASLWRRLREAALQRADVHQAAMAERRLGLIASAANEHSEALSHFDAGLALIASRDDENDLRVRLLLARATTLQTIGHRDDALIDARSALDAASALGGLALLARVHRALLLLHVWTGPASEARAHGVRAVELAVASGERAVEWSAHWAMAIHGGLTGDAPSTAHHLAEARRLADEIRSPVLRLWTADVAIEYLSGTGEWRDALAIAAEAIPAACARAADTAAAAARVDQPHSSRPGRPRPGSRVDRRGVVARRRRE